MMIKQRESATKQAAQQAAAQLSHAVCRIHTDPMGLCVHMLCYGVGICQKKRVKKEHLVPRNRGQRVSAVSVLLLQAS